MIGALPRLKFSPTGSNLATIALRFFHSDPGFRAQHSIETPSKPKGANKDWKKASGKR